MRLVITALLLTLATPMSAQDAGSPAAANASAAGKLSGRWHLKADASTRPPMPPEPPRSQDRSGRGRADEISPEGLLQMRAMTREAAAAPDPITVVATVTSMTITASDGVPRRFTLNGKKEKIDLIAAPANVTSTWDAGALNQEITTGHYRIDRTYQVTADGQQLVVTSRISGGPPESPISKAVVLPTRLVYDKISQ